MATFCESVDHTRPCMREIVTSSRRSPCPSTPPDQSHTLISPVRITGCHRTDTVWFKVSNNSHPNVFVRICWEKVGLPLLVTADSYPLPPGVRAWEDSHLPWEDSIRFSVRRGDIDLYTWMCILLSTWLSSSDLKCEPFLSCLVVLQFDLGL